MRFTSIEAAGHAMQSGVQIEMTQGSPDTEPKHLRVGVNMALCDSAAIARLLMAKGIFTVSILTQPEGWVLRELREVLTKEQENEK